MPLPPTPLDIRFRSGDTTLSGTLHRPWGPAHGSLCLLLSGSGPQDRYQTVAGVPSFQPLADALAASGHAVFCWDDRGVGLSEGDYLSSHSSELTTDALSALDHLTAMLDLDQITAIGHSQGALIAARLANEHPDRIHRLVLLAGMTLPGRPTLLAQHEMLLEAERWPVADRDASLAQKQRVFDVLESIDEQSLSLEQQADLRLALTRALLDGISPSQLNDDQAQELTVALDDLMEWEWRFLLRQDPAIHLTRLQQPLLALFGAQDLQLDARRHAAALQSMRPQGQMTSVEILPGLNHLFQQAHPDHPLDYEHSGPAFVPAACERITSWLNSGVLPVT